jgi:GNAT superfamily N-acetyltransferase
MAETTTAKYKIRYAQKSDVPSILALINELADYEHALHEVRATEETLTSSLSFPDAQSPTGFTPGYAKTLLLIATGQSAGGKDDEALLSASGEHVAGMALFFHNYSTWNAAPGIYLEDLFVRPQYRGAGFGKALIQALARECERLGCLRLDWSVLKWNEPSIRFYQGDSIGATRMEEWVGMRVDGDGLTRLAGGKKGV